jgi:hypothetical protein
MSQHLFTYAVGDLNGDHALLTTLLDRIHAHADGEDYRLVFLGNTIDGGPSGAAVLSALRSMELRAPDRVITLKGWHEALMAGAGNADGLAEWLRHGGGTTLRSFGVTRFADLPREVVDWVARRPTDFRDRLRRYVGDPERALKDGGKGDGLHLLHGCSYIAGRPGADRPREEPGTTDLDTGAGIGGVLTAAILTDLQAEPVGYFQALPDGTTRFLPPLQPAMAVRDARHALRKRGDEPETAAAWALRQDADMHAAQAAMARRASRRRAGWATAAGLVLLAGGGTLAYRPAVSLLARSMAPEGGPGIASAGRPVASTASALAPVAPDGAATPGPEAPRPAPGTASLEPQVPAAPALPALDGRSTHAPSSPTPAPEAELRTHALPQAAPEPAIPLPAEPPPSVQIPAATAALPQAITGSAATQPPRSLARSPDTAAVAKQPAPPPVQQVFAPVVIPPPRTDATPAAPGPASSKPAPPAPAAPVPAVVTARAAAPAAKGKPLATTFALALDPSGRLGWDHAPGGPVPVRPDAALPRQASPGLMALPAPMVPDAEDTGAAESARPPETPEAAPADVPVPPVRPAVLPTTKPKAKPPQQALAPSLPRRSAAPARPGTPGAGALPDVDPSTVEGVNPAAVQGLNPAARRPVAPARPRRVQPVVHRAPPPADAEAGPLDLPSMLQGQPAPAPRGQRRPAQPRPAPADDESVDFDPSQP